ncbi:MAG: LysR family transcriptional regulator [Archangium sp.]|nr:LysR family transcriptional regulator [Archangium sp.]
MTGAARALSLSVNAVSRRLALLETRLGVQLAHRTTRKLSLTPEGQQFVEACRRIIDEVERAEESLEPTPHHLRGLVRVGLHPQLISDESLGRFSALLLEHPHLSVQIFSRNAVVDPVHEGLDLVTWLGDVTLQSVVSKRLAIVDWVMAAAPSYVKRAGLPASPGELEAHQCLRALRDRSERTWVLHDASGRQVSVPVSGSFESDDTATLSAALYSGLGIGIRPRGEVARAVEAGRLVRVLPRWSFASFRVHLVSPPGRLRLPRVRAVAQLIEDMAALLG